MDQLSDATLLLLVKLGRKSAWDQLVDRYKNLVYTVPRRMGLGQDDSEDVFQNTFITLHRHACTDKPPASLPAWLATVARNEAISLIRRKSRQTNLDEVPETGEDDGKAELAVLSHQVARGMSKLNKKCRDLLTSLYLEDNTYVVTSKKLGIAVGAISVTRQRCLDGLRKILE